MKGVFFLVFGLIFAFWGCVPAGKLPLPPAESRPAAEPPPVVLWQPCEPAQVETWRAAASTDDEAALRGAACCAYLVERAGGDLTVAEQGRKLAEQAVAAYPASGQAHYLLGYLAGLEAQRAPLRALDLVKIIEREALAAQRLAPHLDRGGPARMLGDLYLRAPGFPVSIGDPALAVEYFRQAVDQSPKFVENRLGLVEALLTEGEDADACRELHTLWTVLAPERDSGEAWPRALQLQERLCRRLASE
jgi:hypothetical protein